MTPDLGRLDRIAVSGIRGHGYHGVLAEEKRDGQPFVVDVVLGVDTTAAAAADDLTLTVDYSTVAARVLDVVEGPSLDLVETLAQRVADVCLSFDRVEAVVVTVHKPQAPVGVPFDDVTVQIVRWRS
jgi:dihydroneopterin aldolase